MNYIYAREIGQGIYWRQQIEHVSEGSWQCVSQLAQLKTAIERKEVRHLVWITLLPLDVEQLVKLRAELSALTCQLILIYPKDSQVSPLDLPKSEIGSLSVYNEVSEDLAALKLKLQAPLTRIGEGTLAVASSAENPTVYIDEQQSDTVLPLPSKSMKRWFFNKELLSFKKPMKKKSKILKARLAVMGEDYGAYELAAAASLLGSKTAVLDLDRFEPGMDLRLGISAHIPYQYLEVDKAAATGLYVLMDCARLGPLDWETIEKCSQSLAGFEQLYCFTGLYQLSDFEYYATGDLERVLEGMNRYFDLIILRINRFPYDGFTMKAFHWADLILQIMPWELGALRSYKQLIAVLREKQHIKEEKHGLVLVEAEQASGAVLSQWITGVNLLGRVPWSKQRNQNIQFGKAYFKQLMPEISTYYFSIIDQLEVACGTGRKSK